MSTPVTVEVEAVPIVVESTTDDYFVLYVLHDLESRELKIPVLVALGGNGTTTLSENLQALPKERYHLEKYPVSSPADIDGDCIDDITELENPVSMSPIHKNPVNPNSLDLIDGAMTIPDSETFNALSIFHPHSGISNFKFYMVGLDTATPSILFLNVNTHSRHGDFIDTIDIGDLTTWAISGTFFFDPNATAPDGTSGVYVVMLQPYSAFSFETASLAYTMIASSIPLIDNNLAYYVPAADVGYHQYGAASYNESRINILLEDDFISDTPFVPLNPAEGYGLLRIMDTDERPNPRDVVLYDVIPNEMPRVAGIITTAPQTPLSHVNLRAIQDGIPNAFIRDAVDDDSIIDLVGSYVHYTVTSSGWEMTAATQAQVNAHHASSRPAHEQNLHADLSVTSITPLSGIGFDDWDAFGIKATNLAVLRTLNFTAGTTPDGFAIPFYFYDQFMKHNEFYDRINTMLADSEFQTDLSTQESELKKLRKAIKKGQTPEWITTALEDMHGQFANNTSLRYRSSTNNEDLSGFNGAGLYDSKTQHPAETIEDGISKSLKQVYASMWNLRAFAERDFHRVNHTSTMMGVLVHPNYSDELANGVAVSFDPATGSTDAYYVNTQIGEDLVTNPKALSVPEEIKLSKTGVVSGYILHVVPEVPHQSYAEEVNRPEYTVLATSNHMPPGTLLMSNEQMDQMRKYLSTIHDKFADLYEVESGEQFAIEIEFKITSEDNLAIKQARTWVFGNHTNINSPPTVSAGQDRAVTNGTAVSLEGTATDREGSDLTYSWTSDYFGLVITGNNTLAPTFTTPEVNSETAIIFTLTADDGTATSSDSVIITVTAPVNSPPSVEAGHAQTVQEGSEVSLNGSATDSDEDVMTYLWTHNSTSSDITLANATSASTTFTAPRVDSDTAIAFTLTADDGTATSSDSVIITVTAPVNSPPSVEAGHAQTVQEGSEVSLNGSATDSDEDVMTYLWTHNSTLSDITLANATSASTTFTAPRVDSETAIIFTLTADDGTATSSDSVIITVTAPVNSPPSVEAGHAQTVQEGSEVSLNGSATDSDEDVMTYLWTHNSTSSDITLANATSASTTFTAPRVDSDTAIAFTLTADDGTATSSDSVIITVTAPVNSPPSVEAGHAQTVQEGSEVSLNGSATDSDEDVMTYLWTHNSTLSDITLANATSASTTFTAPRVDSDTAIAFTLTADDGTATSSDSVIITVTAPVNSPPSVEAGHAQTVQEGSEVSLNGSATDSDEDVMTYLWTHNSTLSDITLVNATSASTTFTAPRVDSDTAIAFTLTADDGTATSSDSVIITVTAPVNSPPSVEAGHAQTVQEGSEVSLNGSATDSDEDVMTYLWTHNSTLSDITLVNATSASTTFTAPRVDSDTAIAFTLTADDGTATSSDSVIITVTAPVNSPPSVEAGSAQTVQEGSEVSLNGSATDSDEDVMTYLWTHNSTLSDITLVNATSASTTFTAPRVDSDTAIAFTLTADDGTATSSDSVIITVTAPVNSPPSVEAGSAQTVQEGSEVSLNGSATDSDEDVMTYLWTHNSTLSDITLVNATSASTTFTAPRVDSDTAIAFTLTADDGTATSSDSVIITVTAPVNSPPSVEAGPTQTVQGGSKVSLNGSATDSDEDVMTYLWTHNSTLSDITLVNATSASTTFTAPRVDSDTAIAFTLTADDGTATSSDSVIITVTAPVNSPPSVEAGSAQTVQEGSEVSLNGSATDSDEDVMTYLWTHNSTLSDITLVNATSASTTFTAPRVDSDTAIAFTLTADDGTEARSDTVTVTITDVQANDTQTSSVVLEPQEPRGARDIGRIILNSTLPGVMDAAWDAPSETPADYRLSWAKVGTQFLTWTDLSGNAFPTDTSYTITDLEEGEAYKLMVRARYGGTSGDWSGNVAITVAGIATTPVTSDNSTVPGTPRDLSVSRGGNGALTVSWQAPSSDGGLALTGYVVQWKEAGNSWDVPADVSEETTTATTHTVTGLTNGVSYTVRVLATNQAGSGSHSAEETGTPLAPREIAGLTLSSTTPGTILAVWDAPGEAPADYRLSWAKVGTQFLTWTDLSGNAFPTDTSYTITDLEEGEDYKVVVRARYSGTAGDWSGNVAITVTGAG